MQKCKNLDNYFPCTPTWSLNTLLNRLSIDHSDTVHQHFMRGFPWITSTSYIFSKTMGISQSLRKTNIPSVSHDWTTYEIFILFSGMTHTFYMTFSIRLSDVCCIRPQTLSKVFKSYWGDLELSRIVLSIFQA